MPAVVIIFLIKCLTCSPSSGATSTHWASWLIITITAPIQRLLAQAPLPGANGHVNIIPGPPPTS